MQGPGSFSWFSFEVINKRYQGTLNCHYLIQFSCQKEGIFPIAGMTIRLAVGGWPFIVYRVWFMVYSIGCLALSPQIDKRYTINEKR
jgi:hypothetical protein